MRWLVLGALAVAAAGMIASSAGAEILPAALITSGPSGDTESELATFEFTADYYAPLGSFECSFDNGPWTACVSPWSRDNVGGGPHRFAVRLQGPGTDPTPSVRNWVVRQQTVIAPEPVAPPVEPAVNTPLPARRHVRRDAHGCAYGGNEPGEVGSTRLRLAVLCLINRERRSRGLHSLAYSSPLERTAGQQARDMVTRRYFAHVSPSGRGVAARVASTGYLRRARAWTVGEVLAWLVRPRPTPAATVAAWMHSPPHREVLLRPGFRDAGASFTLGNPRSGEAGATWAAEFGRRS